MVLLQRIIIVLLSIFFPLLCFPQLSEQISNKDSSFLKFEKQLYNIKPDKGSLIPVYFVQLDDFQQTITDYGVRFTAQSLINENDFLSRWEKAKHYFDSIKPLITAKMASIDLVLYNEALQSINTADTSLAAQTFLQSLSYNPSYAPAAYELVKMHLKPANSFQAAVYLDQFGKALDSASNPYYFILFKALAEKVLDSMLVYAQKQNKLSLPLDALALLNTAKAFQDKHPSPFGEEKLRQAFTLSHQGMYASLLHIANKALELRKLDLADYYFHQAKQYRQENSNFLEEDWASSKGLERTRTEAEKKISLSHQTKHKKQTKHHRKKKFPKSSAAKPVTTLPTQAAKQVNDTVLNYFLQLEDESFTKQQYYTALNWCDSAYTTNLVKKSIHDTVIRSRYIRSARRIILDSLHSAYFLAWKNDLPHARNILTFSKEYQQKYYLARDKEVNFSIAELESRIQESHCLSTRSLYNENIYRAISQFFRGNYLEGNDYLEAAKTIYLSNQDCRLSDTLRVDLLNRYQGLIQWQTHWKEARQALSVKNHTLFYHEYHAASAVYNTEKLENKGIQFSNLLTFIENQKEPALLLTCLDESLRLERLDEAWELLRLLRENRYSARSLTTQLTVFGKQTEEQDRKNGNTDWLKRLEQSASFYNIAKKSYIRTRKK